MTDSLDDHVLLVDDDIDIREAFQLILELHQHPTAVAGDGAEALTVLRGRPGTPALILLDLMMPGMNGFEFLAEQARSPELADIPVVVFTGAGHSAEEDIRKRGIEVLRKPIDLEVLLATVNRYKRPIAPA